MRPNADVILRQATHYYYRLVTITVTNTTVFRRVVLNDTISFIVIPVMRGTRCNATFLNRGRSERVHRGHPESNPGNPSKPNRSDRKVMRIRRTVGRGSRTDITDNGWNRERGQTPTVGRRSRDANITRMTSTRNSDVDDEIGDAQTRKRRNFGGSRQNDD